MAARALMIETMRQVYELLTAEERRRGWLVGCLMILRAAAETVGVVSVMPFIAVASNPDIIHQSRLLSTAYSTLNFTDTNQFLVALGTVVFVVLVLSLATGAFAQRALYRFSQQCNYGISSRLLERYLTRDYAWFLNKHSSDLGKTILAEVDQIIAFIILPFMNMVSRIVITVFLILIVIIVDPLITTTAAIVFGGLYLIIFMLTRKRVAQLGAEMYATNEERFRLAQETLGGIKDVKIAGLERVYADRYRDIARRFSDRQARYEIIADLPRFFLEGIAFGGMVAATLFLLLTRDGGLSAALPVIALYAFAGYRLLPALQQIYHNLASIEFAKPALARIHTEMAALSPDSSPSPPQDWERDDLPLRLSDRIALRDVTFTYDGASRPIFDGLNLTIEANTTVGFVGSTGAGKTTLIDLILGLLRPDSGHLLVDESIISPDNTPNWQSNLGYVPQQIFLIDDTIAANIAFGIPPERVDTASLEKAIRMAGLHDFTANLEKGHQTVIGERGARLSGGQRQRIGVARALYRNPQVLILDEATSALDNVTERAVMDAVRNLGRKMTIIIIAHRLSTVRMCDRIFLLDNGQVRASGTFNDLIEASEEFRALSNVAE